jgi:hypothetical protein
MFGQSGAQLAQEQFGLGLIGLTDQVGLGLDGVRTLIAAHRLGPCAAFPHEGLVPTHGTGRTDLEASGGLPA